MINSSYSDAIDIIPIYIIATIVSVLSSFLGSIFGAIKKTKIIFTTTLYGSIVNVICIYALINIIGVQAASIALFLGFMVNIILRIKVLKKYMNLKIEYKYLFCEKK